MYEDIEVNDFNTLHTNENIIGEQFGKSICVNVTANNDEVKRIVSEHLGMVTPVSLNEQRKALEVEVNDKVREDDIDLATIGKQLLKIQEDFGKSREEVIDLYVQASGRPEVIRLCLSNKKGEKAQLWNVLEDFALQKPDDSPEF